VAVPDFEENGSDRLIEVKTTAYGKQTPFFVTRNELSVSRDRDRAFQLYRLFCFRQDPRRYILPGALSRSCHLEACEYLAHPA